MLPIELSFYSSLDLFLNYNKHIKTQKNTGSKITNRKKFSEVIKRKRVPKQKRKQEKIRKQNRNKRVNVALKTSPSESLSEKESPLLVTPLSFLQSSGENQWRGLKIGAFGPPGGQGKAKSESPFEEKREAPSPVKRREGFRGFFAEKRRVVPVEVAGDLGGDEQLRLERR